MSTQLEINNIIADRITSNEQIIVKSTGVVQSGITISKPSINISNTGDSSFATNSNIIGVKTITHSNISQNTFQYSRAFYGETKHLIASGVANSGNSVAVQFAGMRNFSSSGDAGYLDALYGIAIQYGHNILDSGVTPQTNNIYGLYIEPYNGYGTINNSYDIFARPGAYSIEDYGVINNSYGIYIQGSNKKHLLEGKLGIGTNNPSYQLDVIGSGNFSQNLFVNGTGVSISGHSHTSSNISDFSNSVSGLLPVKNIIAGSNVTVSSTSGIYTINASSSSIDAGEYPLITISSQPSGISVAESSEATFSVTATASYPSGTISYQWQNSSDNTNWSNIVSANSSTLTLTSVTSSDNGKYYRCNLQSLLSNINSNSAQLTVTTGFITTSVILSSGSNYTVPNGAQVLKMWSIGAGGTATNLCDGGNNFQGLHGTVSYRHGFISNTNVVISGSVGQPVVYSCNLTTPGGSTTLSNLSTVINPSISSLIGGGGGIDGGVSSLPSSGGLSTYTLWSNNTTRRDFVGINAVIDAAGGNSATHTYGKAGRDGGNGSAGAIVMQFLPATDLVLPFTDSGSLTIPAGYSSVKIWVVGGGGIGQIYCDGGPNTDGGFGGISYKTWSVSVGQTITYNAGASLVGNFCLNPRNGNSSTATLNGTTITATAGLANGNNGSGSGGDGNGIYGSDVGGIYDAYLAYSPSVLTYGIRGDYRNNNRLIGGIVLIKLIV